MLPGLYGRPGYGPMIRRTAAGAIFDLAGNERDYRIFCWLGASWSVDAAGSGGEVRLLWDAPGAPQTALMVAHTAAAAGGTFNYIFAIGITGRPPVVIPVCTEQLPWIYLPPSSRLTLDYNGFALPDGISTPYAAWLDVPARYLHGRLAPGF